jgi:carbonic anhydrase
MRRLNQGVHKFQQDVFGTHERLFRKLAETQTPHTLFITCSDSRINPNMLTQSEPGEIFILRNAGNIIPSYNIVSGGEAATIEFALAGLGIEHIVVCGHSNCGAMKAVINPELTQNLPALKKWLFHAEPTKNLLHEIYTSRTEDDHLNITIQENVLLQLENLRTHPTVATRLAEGKLHLYGWVYKIPTGEVFAYDPTSEQFHSLVEYSGESTNPNLGEGNDATQI